MDKAFHPCLYLDQPKAPYAEAVRTLRAHIMQQLQQGRKSFLVASSWEGEGKSAVCINLAAAVSEFGHSTLLVDGDLRQRSLTRLLLEEEQPQAFAISRSPWLPKVDVMGASWQGDNASDALAQPEFRQALTQAMAPYDLVLVDSPPLAVCSDALLLVSWVDGVLFVTSQEKFKGVAEGNYSEALREHGAAWIGVVVTASSSA